MASLVPRLLGLDVNMHLEPVVQYVRDCGLTGEHIVRIIMCYGLEYTGLADHLTPRQGWMKERHLCCNCTRATPGGRAGGLPEAADV